VFTKSATGIESKWGHGSEGIRDIGDWWRRNNEIDI